MLSDSLRILREAGYEVPPVVEDYVKGEELKRRGVQEVWTCNCGHVYESPLPLISHDHGCGKVAKRTWSA